MHSCPAPLYCCSTTCTHKCHHAVCCYDFGSCTCGLQNYKETCKDISYDCSTYIITATCGNDKTNVSEASAFNTSSLHDAYTCEGNIENVWGILKCQPAPSSDSSPSASSHPSSACVPSYFVSHLDQSGGDAPDGVSTSSWQCHDDLDMCVNMWSASTQVTCHDIVCQYY